MAYTFGVPKSGGVNWLMQSLTETPAKDKAEARDNNGAVADVKYYNETEQISFNAIIPSDAVAPKPGETFAFGGHNYVVDTASKNYGNTTHASFAVTATRYITNGIPGDDSSSN